MKKMFVLSAGSDADIEMEPIAILTNDYNNKIREAVEHYLVGLGYSKRKDEIWFDEIVDALWWHGSYDDIDGESEVRFMLHTVDVY